MAPTYEDNDNADAVTEHPRPRDVVLLVAAVGEYGSPVR